jgi:RHS repeat-associated protein
MDYMPFGETMADAYDTQVFWTGAREKYTGQSMDWWGRYYYGARYYDQEIGRFTQADTIVPRPLDGQTFNRYSYAGNNPYKYNDPTGHSIGYTSILLGGILAAVGARVGAVVGLKITKKLNGREY